MKKYLFGLGAMLVGAGLMFALMHGEVRADDIKEVKCEVIDIGDIRKIKYCKINDLTCVIGSGNLSLSCVKTGFFK